MFRPEYLSQNVVGGTHFTWSYPIQLSNRFYRQVSSSPSICLLLVLVMPYRFDQTVIKGQYLTDCQQNLIGKYNYYEMKGVNVQDSRYVQRSDLDRLETESEVIEPKHVTSALNPLPDAYSTSSRLLAPETSSADLRSVDLIES